MSEMTREEAITKLVAYSFWASEHVPDEVAQALDIAIEALKEQRPHGEWIDEGVMADGCSQHAFRCPKCGNHISRIPSDMPNFCENCGAKLETVGYWFPDWSESYGKDGFRCSMCYRWTSEKEEKCHHCGARMKEGE